MHVPTFRQSSGMAWSVDFVQTPRGASGHKTHLPQKTASKRWLSLLARWERLELVVPKGNLDQILVVIEETLALVFAVLLPLGAPGEALAFG